MSRWRRNGSARRGAVWGCGCVGDGTVVARLYMITTAVESPETTAGRVGRRSLARRLAIYQRERFPLARYAPLVTVFAFSAAAYSRLLRGVPGFIRPGVFVAGVFTTLILFFLLRVLDEHKDATTDRRYRPELPVPRGLVTLVELRAAGLAALLLALLLNALLAPRLLWALAVFAVWAALMTKEFFIGAWLRRHVTAYLLTHMAI